MMLVMTDHGESRPPIHGIVPALAALPDRALSLAGQVLEIVLPAQCSICRARIMDHHALCSECWSQLDFITAPCCERSGVPLAYDTGAGTISPAALNRPPAWDRARAAVVFDDHSRQLVHALKYRDRQDAALVMTQMMRHAGRELISGCDWIVPVPLYRWRLWSRRFNQSALLAQRVAEDATAQYRPDVLVRHRATQAQVGLDHSARRRNVRGAFQVDTTRAIDISGRRILLIDDVITTGATANACVKTLRKAGASQVNVLSFALVLNPAQTHI